MTDSGRATNAKQQVFPTVGSPRQLEPTHTNQPPPKPASVPPRTALKPPDTPARLPAYASPANLTNAHKDLAHTKTQLTELAAANKATLT